jgi:tight adherence protein C
MNVRVMKLAALGVIALAFFILAYAVAVVPIINTRRLGLRGLKRHRALEGNGSWSNIEPVVRWIGARLSGFLGDEQRVNLNHQLMMAGDFLGLLPEELIGFSMVTAVAGVFGGTLLGWLSGMGGMLIVLCAGFGAIAPYMTVSSLATERSKRLGRGLPYAIDLLALGMGAGLDFPGAVRQLVEKSGIPDDPMTEEFTLMLQSLQLGRTRRQALEDFAARAPIDAVLEFVGAVVQAELRGTPVVNVLRIQAEVSRQRRSVRAEEAASKAGVAMVGPLMLVFIAILLLIVAPMMLKLQKEGM